MRTAPIDPEMGHVFGARGKAARKTCRGYVVVMLSGRQKYAHRLIWESVHGAIPGGLQINHINGDKRDNRIANLELVTPSENVLHAYRLGLRNARGENNGRAKLTFEKAAQIRGSAHSVRSLAHQYGVSHATIRKVLSGQNWSQS